MAVGGHDTFSDDDGESKINLNSGLVMNYKPSRGGISITHGNNSPSERTEFEIEQRQMHIKSASKKSIKSIAINDKNKR